MNFHHETQRSTRLETVVLVTVLLLWACAYLAT